MNKKKESKPKTNGKAVAGTFKNVGEIANESDLKAFLLSIRDKMAEELAAPIFAVSALNHILTSTEFNIYLNDENKEIARDIWLRVRQSGFQVRNPPMLFGNVEDPLDPALRNNS